MLLRDAKVAYRKLMAQHHPDKLVSQGCKTHDGSSGKEKPDIQAAYEYLKNGVKAINFFE